MNKLKTCLKLIFIIIISSLFLTGFGFSSEPINYNDTTTTALNSSSSASSLLEKILNIGYIFLWPALIIGGAAMDNSLIYGSAINLDQYLWQVWNIMKNFANFGLGFLFLISIFFYFFGFKQDKFSPRRIIPKLLLGSVIIQASWFIIAALIDIATIMTYSLGAMPLNIIKGNELLDREILIQNSIIDLKNIDEAFSATGNYLIWFSHEGNSYLPCTFERKEGDYIFSGDMFQKIQQNASANGVNGVDAGNCVIQYLGNRLVPASESSRVSEIMEKIKEDSEYGRTIGTKLSEIINHTTGITGVFYTLIGSYIGTSGLTTSGFGHDSTVSTSALGAIFIMKIITAIALLVPLFALVLVLIIRIFFLWALIMFSPILMFIYTFDLSVSEKLGKYSISSFLWLIFMPVFVVFALSIGLIFMTVITESIANPIKQHPFMVEDAVCDTNHTGRKIAIGDEGKGINVCFEKPNSSALGTSVFLDYFSWLLINFVGIAILWIMVFAAIKSAKITSGVADFIDRHARGMLKTVPLIPSGKGVHSIGELKRAGGRLSATPGNVYELQYGKGLGQSIRQFEQKFTGNGGNNSGNSDSSSEDNSDQNQQSSQGNPTSGNNSISNSGQSGGDDNNQSRRN